MTNRSKVTFILLLALIYCTCLESQVSIYKDEIDDFTKNRNASTNYGSKGKILPSKNDWIDTKNNLALRFSYMMDGKDSVEWYMPAFMLLKSGLGCLSEHSGYAEILFNEFSEPMVLFQLTNTTCEDSYAGASYLLISRDEYENGNTLTNAEKMAENVELLLKYTVKKIRIHGSDYYGDYELKPDKQSMFKEHIQAIKKLLVTNK